MKTQPSFQHRSPTGHGPLRVAWGLLLAAACVVLFGCGRGGPEVVRVTGKVTFGGGAWPAEGVLYFTPVEPAEGMPARPAPADFDKEGNFTVTSFDEGDGLVPGKYRVAVECWESAPSMDKPGPVISYVAKKYQTAATSDLVVVIESGSGTTTVELDVPKQ